jgi:hypothetical protein
MKTLGALLSIVLTSAFAAPAVAQHEHHHEQMQEAPQEPAGLTLPHQREASGTSWQPDSTPLYAHHFMAGSWMLMLHYAAEAGYDAQIGTRGSHRFLSINWVMGMASHPLLGGELTLRAMFSLEPATAAGPLATPLFLQSGETYEGFALHDRQHPHDFFMETAAIWRRPLGQSLGLELYAAASGEPALGPTAFMHRVSATINPLSPIGHHWQDATHIRFGVLTAGLYTGWLKLEGSLFHGMDPDENRWDFDFGPLDSWSARASVNPTSELSFQASYGFVHSMDRLAPGEDHRLISASATFSKPWRTSGNLSATAIFGHHMAPDHFSDSALLETTADLDGVNVPFLRLEYVGKLGHDLVTPGAHDEKFPVLQAQIGYVRRFPIGPVVPTIGVVLDVSLIPSSLEPLYDTRVPIGGFVFVGLQPPPLRHSGM